MTNGDGAESTRLLKSRLGQQYKYIYLQRDTLKGWILPATQNTPRGECWKGLTKVSANPGRAIIIIIVMGK